MEVTAPESCLSDRRSVASLPDTKAYLTADSMPPTTHRNALQPGHQIHWYRIEGILGQGGFGLTYLAHDANLDQQVAIKEYLPIELAVRERDSSVHPVSEQHHETFRWGLERFISEARTLARFDHPNIVRVLSVFEQNNTAYMVMRYERGKSLQEMLPRHGTIEEAPLLAILFPILGGLAKVHVAGFIHRDIKPANIFVREDGSPVLLDFGSARQSLGRETKTLTTLVSPGYAPYEQYYSKSDRQGPWTDVYGIGATLYRAAVGVAPMDALDRSEGLLKKKNHDPYQSAVEIAAGRYSQRFLAAIDHALAFREEDRPQSLAQWTAEFALPDAPTEIAQPGPAAMPPAATPDEAPTERDPEPGADGAAPTTSTPDTQPDTTTASGAPDQAPADATTLYRAFLGPERADPYLSRFERFDARGKAWPLAWHWPAALFTIPWMAYRRLYLWAIVLYPLVTVALTFVVVALTSVIFFDGGDVPARVQIPVLALIALSWPGCLGHAIYYRRAKRCIAKSRALSGDRRAWLAKRGGTSRAATALAVFVLALLALAGGAGEKHERAKASAAARAPAAAPSSAPVHTPAIPAAQPQTAEQRIKRLLRAATEDIAALRLSTPAGDNAIEKLREVLRLDPGNADAEAALRGIVKRYARLAEQALGAGKFAKAAEFLQRAREIAPDTPGMKRLRRRIELEQVIARGKDAAKNHDFRAAERYLKRALGLAPDNPELRRLLRRALKRLGSR